MHRQSRVDNATYMCSKPLEDLPIPMVHGGIALKRFLHDTTHSQLLGTSKVLNGSVLTYLIETGDFGAFPRAGVYEDNLASLCRPAFISFKSWMRAHGLSATQPRFTASRMNRKHRGMFPCLASKAANGKRVSFWLASLCNNRARRPGATLLDQLVSVCMWSYCEMLRLFDQCGMVLSPGEASLMHDRGMLHLLTYAHLRLLSSRSKKKELLRSSFCILPKHHFLQHALDEALESLINPGVYNLLAAESFVGCVGRISRKCHRRSVSKRTLEKYICGVLRIRLEQYKKRLRGA